MVVPKSLVEEVDGQKFFKIKCTHFPTIKLLTGLSASHDKNPSIAWSAGILAVKTARNVQSGLMSLPSALQADMGTEAQPKKKPRKRGAAPVTEPTVTFKVPSDIDLPQVTTKRSVSIEENLMIPLTEECVSALFTNLTHFGIDVRTSKRSYQRSGRFQQSNTAEPGDGVHSGDEDDEPEE